MLNGIELAGLHLAALPLFISAAELYKEGIGFGKRALRKETFADQYHAELGDQQSLLETYVSGVVKRTSLTPQTQLMLLDDPTGEAWQRQDVAKQMRAELGDAYQPFLSIITRICKTLAKQIKVASGDSFGEDELIQHLQTLCIEESRTSTVQGKMKILKRIKFSWKAPERAIILAELEACNSKLHNLIIAADRAKPYERKQRYQRVHEAFEHREDIQRLFDVMKNACKCEPSGKREVGLRLQVHPMRDEDVLDSTFQMIFFHSKDIIYELSAKIERTASEEPRKKKVRISTSDDYLDQQKTKPDQKMKLLEDICKEIALAHSCNCCLQLVVDKHEKVYCNPRQTPHTRSPKTPQQLLSLTEIMSELKLYNHKRWLHREKSILAIILAYSLLHLHDSPWSQAEWKSDKITFINTSPMEASQSDDGLHYQLRNPYARAQVPTIAASGAKTVGRRTLLPPPTTRKNAHLHALGVVLLELYLNRSIDEDVLSQCSDDYRSVAQDLLEEHADDMTMTPEYLKAVRFCLSPYPNPFSGLTSFGDKGFREIYYMEVIAMVESNLTSRFEVGENSWTVES